MQKMALRVPWQLAGDSAVRIAVKKNMIANLHAWGTKPKGSHNLQV